MFQRRKTLLPFLKAAKQLKMQAFLNVDNLVIEGNTYEIENLHDVPDSLKFMANCYKQDIQTVAFYGSRSHLSNFYLTSFSDEFRNEFHSTEQYLQYHKALLFHDEIVATKILNARNPAHAKALSYQVLSD